MNTQQPPRLLRGTELRYALIRLLQLCGPSTLIELHPGLLHWGFAVEGRPSKTLSDALRWEMRRDRARRIGRGVYRAGGMPRSTEHRIIARVRALRAETTPPPGRYDASLALTSASDGLVSAVPSGNFTVGTV